MPIIGRSNLKTMTSVLCGACALKITTESDRIYCFGGCDQILHAKCSDLTSGGVIALKECVSLRYVCFSCRKKEICLNDVSNKCTDILSDVSTVKVTQANFAAILEDSLIKQRELLENAIADRVLVNMTNLLQNKVLITEDGNSVREKNINRSYADVVISENSSGPKEGGLLRSGKRRLLNNGSTNTKQNDSNHELTASDATTPVIPLAKRKISMKPKSPTAPKTPAKTKAVSKLEQTVIIKPKVPQHGDVTKTAIREKLDPVQFCVKDVFFKPNGDALIQCSSNSLAMNLLKSAQSQLSDKYEVEILKPLKPRLKIVGFSVSMKQEELIYKLRKQNGIPTSAELKLIHLTDEKHTRKSAIIETDAKTFALLMDLKRVHLGWERCVVFESINVLRCFNCSEYGHTATNCSKPACCPKCAEYHEVNECTSDYEKCVNCTIVNKEKNLPADFQVDVCHSSWSSECPVYQKRMKKFRQRIDYSS